ncbi:RTA1 domain protein [Penicillium solitum]|uniref:RTA1 domain protein n=1 Tax=Penicillium solitum TaxID=60172 RepID=UPI0032C411D4|nr:RTA1 domain protein [Penicillium solitum]
MSGIYPNGTMIDPSNCTLDTCPLSMARLTYIPSLYVNSAFSGVFILYMVIQLVQFFLYRTSGYSIGMLIGLALEILGYGARIAMHFNPFKKITFVIQLIGLTIGPAFLSAAIYLCLGRIVTVYGPQISRIKPRLYSTIFMTCDVVSLILQAAGGALASTGDTQDDVDMGVNIMIAGLIAQVVSLSAFSILCADFAIRAKRRREQHNHQHTLLRRSTIWKLLLIGLFIATIAIYIRSAYRIAELWGGFQSHLANDQTTFIIFEGAMMIAGTTVLTAFHPGLAFCGTWKKMAGGAIETAQSVIVKPCSDSEYELLGRNA